MIENLTVTQDKRQEFLRPPPLRTRERKLPQNTFLSFLDQGTDGLYGGLKLVRNEPRKPSDTYFVIKTFKSEVRSNRRNKTHRNIALFRTKRDGPTRANIEYMTGSFLELDGAIDNTIKSLEDVLTLIKNFNLPTASYVIETSRGHYHVIWTYVRPLPWKPKNESYWMSQQKRLIELFKQAHFNVDVGASMNPTQNLRNPSQLRPFNFKRGCQVHIHKTYQKTSLRAIFRALNSTNIPNPRRVPASTKLRRFLRANQTFTLTHQELAESVGTSLSTAERVVKRAIANGDMFSVGKVGNNKGITRATRYRSGLYLEPQFSEPSHSISKDNSLKKTAALAAFRANGSNKGYRNKTVFVLAVGLSYESNKTLTVSEIADKLRGGSLRSGLSEKELVRTIKNAVKPVYSNPFSLPKMREWNLIVETKHFH